MCKRGGGGGCSRGRRVYHIIPSPYRMEAHSVLASSVQRLDPDVVMTALLSPLLTAVMAHIIGTHPPQRQECKLCKKSCLLFVSRM